MSIIDNLALECDDLKDSEGFAPEETPVSMLDVDRMPPMDMDLPMSDGCPRCGGHNMRVGDYVCWGVCMLCFEEAIDENDR